MQLLKVMADAFEPHRMPALEQNSSVLVKRPDERSCLVYTATSSLESGEATAARPGDRKVAPHVSAAEAIKNAERKRRY